MEPIIKTIIEAFSQAKYPPSYIPKQELSDRFYDITSKHIIWSSGFRKGFERAYEENRDALRKALIAILKHSNSYFQDQISKYPSLQDDYDKNTLKNKALITKIEQLW